jgi:hypothetical protein
LKLPRKDANNIAGFTEKTSSLLNERGRMASALLAALPPPKNQSKQREDS